MDQNVRLKVRNPKHEANFFSKLFFIWIVKLYRKVLRNGLEVSDLCKVLDSDKSKELGDVLEEKWSKEVMRAKMKNKKPKLLKPLVDMFFKEYMIYGGVLFLQHVILRSAQPVILAYLISLFGEDSNNHTAMYSSTAILVLITFFIVFTMHHVQFGQCSIGMRVRVAVCTLIYRKTLKLNRKALTQTSIGQIVNFLSNDVTRFDLVVIALHYLWILPFQVTVITFLCWMQIGVSCLVGVILIALLSLPLQGYLGKLTSKFRAKVAEKCDSRITLMSEIISGIQVIKMYTWEKPFENLVRLARSKEMKALTVTSYLRGIYLSFMVFVERTALFLTLTCYVCFGNTFLAQQVFSLSQFFNLLQLTMSVFFPLAISYGAESLVSIKRIELFLSMEENEKSIIEKNPKVGVSLHQVTASWKCDPFLQDISFEVPKGSLCAIVGPVGVGKSSILHLLLNELTPKCGTIKIQGAVSFASQEPWLFASTVRDNILFGSQYNRKLYSKVVKVCALQKDFSQFPFGDKTLVGERGASLSGGQRTRINLARAVYRNADVYLFDDPLSSVDIHVGKHLFKECIVKYLHGKTRILVTHQIQYLKSADFIVVINNGKVEAQGTYKQLAKSHLKFAKETNEEENSVEEDISVLTLSDNSLQESGPVENECIEEEERGMIDGTESLFRYVTASRNIPLIILVVFTLILSQTLCSGVDYWVTFWTEQEYIQLNLNSNKTVTSSPPKLVDYPSYNTDDRYETKNFTQNEEFSQKPIVDTYTALYIYLALIISTITVTFVRSFLYFKLAMITSTNLHHQMFTNLLEGHMRFFNTNPAGRILNRFSKDLGAVDEILPKVLLEATQIGLTMCGILVMVVVSNFYMIPVIIILGVVFWKIRTWFVNVTKEIKHMEGITKSPVFSHLSSSLHGITTIRAFGAQEELRNQFDHYQDIHTSAWFLLITTTSSFGLWLDLVCLTFIASTSFSFILLNHYQNINGSLVGLAISQSLILTGMLQYGVRQSAEVVNQLTSVERIFQYNEIEKESFSTNPDHQPPLTWPQKGFILIDNMYLRYSSTKPYVLKKLNIEIEAGQKVGIVGRTGAGKSSLITALFRLSEISGAIFIDGINTKNVGLHDLRRKVSIIPQEPVLFSITLRQNLDPFSEFDDGQIWNVLEEVELKNSVASLDVAVSRNGGNFSVGQRQLLCLARAMLRNNKILVLDEATANIDQKTDSLIQDMIRKKFRDCTVLTIAHRLQTVMDSDKIIVMDNGKIVEYDHPYLLLQNANSTFYKMVYETDDKTSDRLEHIALNAFLHRQNETDY